MRLDIAVSDVVITNTGSYEIYGTTNEHNIYVNCEATIILDNININIDLGVTQKEKAAIVVDKSANLKLILRGSNNLKSTENHAGIEIIGTSKVVISSEDSLASLEVQAGNSGAGLGGGYGDDFKGDLTIESGIFNIVSGREGAGIGGGNGANGGGDFTGSLTIDGSTLNISSGDAGGAAMGGGCNGNLIGSVIINGGNIYATNSQYGFGAGIGGGYEGDLSGSVLINNGEVVTTGGSGAAGIGGGIRINKGGNLSGTVLIHGGSINATGGIYINSNGEIGGGAGIGGAYNGNLSGAIQLHGGIISAYGPGSAADLGAGSNGAVTGDVNIKVKSISVNPSLLKLNIGDSQTLTSQVVLEPEVNARISDYTQVQYKSNDDSIATVAQNGLVIATGQGETEIIATSMADKTKSAICYVNVSGKTIEVGDIDLLIEVEKDRLKEEDLSNVVCYGNNPIIKDIKVDECLDDFYFYIKLPQCENEIPASAKYKHVNVYFTVDYSIVLYSGDSCKNDLKVYALQGDALMCETGFCISKNENIDVSNFKIVIMPQYTVDQTYSNKYYLFKVVGKIVLIN